MLGAIGESVLGASTIRAHGVEERTARRIDAAVEEHRRAAVSAHVRSSVAFSSGQLVTGATLALVLGVGTWLAANGRMTLGELLAFLFLVNLFTMPVQQATEILNELQNAVAGWRRVLDVVETPADIVRLLDLGVEAKEVNVGGMTFKQGTKALSQAVYVSDKDVEDFKEIDSRGVKQYIQQVPSSGSAELMGALKSKGFLS